MYSTTLFKPYPLRYATAEVFLNKGVRINGDVGTVLSSQLITPTSKTTTDERGWYSRINHVANYEVYIPLSFLLSFTHSFPLPFVTSFAPIFSCPSLPPSLLYLLLLLLPPSLPPSLPTYSLSSPSRRSSQVHIDTPQTHTTVLNLFTQHGWTLNTAFQCNAMLPGSSNFTPEALKYIDDSVIYSKR